MSSSLRFKNYVVCLTTVKTACRGVGSSLKLGEQKGGLLWREREPIAGVWGHSPQRGPEMKPPEADDILLLEHTSFALPWSLYW